MLCQRRTSLAVELGVVELVNESLDHRHGAVHLKVTAVGVSTLLSRVTHPTKNCLEAILNDFVNEKIVEGMVLPLLGLLMRSALTPQRSHHLESPTG